MDWPSFSIWVGLSSSNDVDNLAVLYGLTENISCIKSKLETNIEEQDISMGISKYLAYD